MVFLALSGLALTVPPVYFLLEIVFETWQFTIYTISHPGWAILNENDLNLFCILKLMFDYFEKIMKMHLHVWQTFLHNAFICVEEDYDSQAIDHFFIAEL